MLYPTSATFLDREQQRKKIVNALDDLSKNGAPLKVLEFYGIGGLGKSRILDEAKSQCRERNLPFAGVDLMVSNRDASGFGDIDLLLRICDQLDHAFPRISEARAVLASIARVWSKPQDESGANDFSQASELNFSSTIAEFRVRLSEALAGQPLILLLDSTEQCPDTIFDWLGTDLLRPLLDFENTFVLMFLGGRGARVGESRWPTALKRSTHSFRLDPLDFKRTTEQIGNLPPEGQYRAAAEEIFAISNGHPYSTEAIVHHLHTLEVQVDVVGVERQRLAHRLYDEVIQQYILADADEWVLPFIEIACIPRRFEAAILKGLLPRFRPEIVDNEPIQWYLARLADLQERPLHLVHLGKGRPVYELEPTLRKLLHTALVILSPDEVVILHQEMANIWERQLVDTIAPAAPSASAITEILYHVAVGATIKEQDAVQATQATLERLLQTHFRPRRTKHMEELNILQDLLANDGELSDLLDKVSVEVLIDWIDEFLQPTPSPDSAFQFSHLIIEHDPPNELQVSWYMNNQIVLPTERIHCARRYPIDQWRNETKTIGKATFQYYLPERAQSFVRNRQDLAIQLSTDWTDIPWELLHDGREFLCLSRPIARKPKMLREPREHSPHQGSLRALIIGDPTDDLSDAKAEARAVARLLEQADVKTDLLLGSEQATAAAFSLKLVTGSYDLIHYAGHGYFETGPSHLSGLKFADGPFFAEELERGLSSRAFVFLNTCEATETKTQHSTAGFHGKFIEGLATSVLLGGAAGCLGPMCNIGDTIAKNFALAFYRYILDGESLGEAVRQARTEVQTEEFDTWAPWVLYGDLLYSFERN